VRRTAGGKHEVFIEQVTFKRAIKSMKSRRKSHYGYIGYYSSSLSSSSSFFNKQVDTRNIVTV